MNACCHTGSFWIRSITLIKIITWVRAVILPRFTSSMQAFFLAWSMFAPRYELFRLTFMFMMVYHLCWRNIPFTRFTFCFDWHDWSRNTPRLRSYHVLRDRRPIEPPGTIRIHKYETTQIRDSGTSINIWLYCTLGYQNTPVGTLKPIRVKFPRLGSPRGQVTLQMARTVRSHWTITQEMSKKKKKNGTDPDRQLTRHDLVMLFCSHVFQKVRDTARSLGPALAWPGVRKGGHRYQASRITEHKAGVLVMSTQGSGTTLKGNGTWNFAVS